MSVKKIFSEFRCIFVKRSFKTETGETASYLFSLFYKCTMFFYILWVHTNKNRPFTVPNDVLFLPFMSKNYGVFNLFPLMS